jgi:hypothetical protein
LADVSLSGLKRESVHFIHFVTLAAIGFDCRVCEERGLDIATEL